jgi:TBC1 domain family protein 5
MEFFQAESTHAMMLDVLFIWSCENSDVSYRQGMHELLAVILYVLHREYLEDAEAERAAAEVAESPVRGMSAVEVINAFDSKYLVHDAYALFKNVMNQMKDFFAPAAPGDTQTEVVRKCHHIHHQLLRKYDLELYTYLERHQIEPQLYALRWVRLLLSRELHIDDAVVLWDALFASDPNFSLLDHIIVAILVFIREDLIGKDYSACLKRLFKLPSVIDIQVFVSEALQMRNPGAKALTFSTLSGGVFPAPQPAAPAPSRGFLRRGPAAQDPLSSPAQAAPRHTLPSAVAVRQYFAQKSASMDAPSTRFLNEALNRLEDDVHKLKAQQLQAGASLESIVDTLQNELLGGGSINQNNVIMALAELKQVRDLLNDHL